MNEENKNSIDNNNLNSINTDKDFVAAEDTVSNNYSPVVDETSSSFDEQRISLNEETKKKKNDNVTIIFQSCLIVVLISAFVMVITIFTNKNSSFRAFIKPNPDSKAVIVEEHQHDIKEEEEIPKQEEEPVDNNISEDDNKTINNETPEEQTPKKETKKSKSSKKSSSSNNNSTTDSSTNNSNNTNDSNNSIDSSTNNSNNQSSQPEKKYDVIHYGYIDLDASKNVRPSGTIKRSLAARWLVKLNGHEAQLGSLSNISSPFVDVNSSTVDYKYILAAYKLGYISGGTNNDYRPNIDLTRAEAVTIILKVLEVEGIKKESTGSTRVYEDVQNQWYRDFVYQATDYGIVNGVSIGKGKYMFYPERSVTRKEFITMLYKAFNRNDSGLNCEGFPDNNPFNDIQATDKIYAYYLDGYATHYCTKK